MARDRKSLKFEFPSLLLMKKRLKVSQIVAAAGPLARRYAQAVHLVHSLVPNGDRC